MKNPWRNLSVSNKLFIVVGVMALLVASELLTLAFVMNTLSAVRAFVNGESLYSKAHQGAVLSLHEYARTQDPKYYAKFIQDIDVIMGDRVPRTELVGTASYNYDKVRDGIIQGRNHPDDVDGLIKLIRRFQDVSYVKEAISLWSKADDLVDELLVIGEKLHLQVSTHAPVGEINTTLNEITAMDGKLIAMESRFSLVLGEGSRWLSMVLLFALVFFVLAVETTGLILTISITRNLTLRIKELKAAATKLEQNNDSKNPGTAPTTAVTETAHVDDLTALADTLNKMASDLKNSEKANRLKSLFLANMSHEMRTPLGAIIGFTRLLQTPNLNPTDRDEYIKIIEKTGESLTKIINDILDLSKVEAGYLEVEKVDFSLKALLKEVRILCHAKLGKKQVEVILETREPFPDYINTDPQRLQQILMNLLSNAIKFTEYGRVKIICEAEKSELVFRIQDTGVGIPVDKQHLLFKSFSQVDNSLSRKHEGTGLGLVLSRHLARMLDGDVVLESSEPGRGTNFMITIPYKTPLQKNTQRNTPDKAAEAIAKIRGKSILLVDDSEINRLLLNRVLTNQGILVTLAENGEEAVNKALEKNYDAILMDIQMPVMDGRTATRRLRANGYKKTIIALTAHAMKEDRDRCLEAGCNEYLTKPVDFETLFNTLAKFIEANADINGPSMMNH